MLHAIRAMGRVRRAVSYSGLPDFVLMGSKEPGRDGKVLLFASRAVTSWEISMTRQLYSPWPATELRAHLYDAEFIRNAADYPEAFAWLARKWNGDYSHQREAPRFGITDGQKEVGP